MTLSITPPVPVRHYLQFKDFSADDYAYLLARAWLIKQKFKTYQKHHTLTDRTLAMIFEKASTRTRVSFEAGMYQLGGTVVHLTTGDSQLGRSEPIEDSARVISRMTDIVMIRTFGQEKIERFAEHSRVPVINGLTNEFHPCQILADLFTWLEYRGKRADGSLDVGALKGITVAWVGDGNNMANTWLQAADILGFQVHVSTPSGYEVNPEVAGVGRGDCWKVFKDPMEACRGADLVTTERSPDEGLCRLVRDARDDGCGQARRPVHALPACPPGRGSDRRRDRRPAKRGVGRSREPHACAEGADGIPAARPAVRPTLS
jgi:ornithine carbamoyltransferase